MRDILPRHNKKGVSEIVSYVILIIIAISIGALVFNYLLKVIPKERPACDEVSISINDATCDITNNNLTLVLRNTGLFTIDAAYVRIGVVGKEIRYRVNTDESGKFEFASGINPKELRTISYPLNYLPTTFSLTPSQDYILEVQISMYDEDTKSYAACEQRVTQKITCN